MRRFIYLALLLAMLSACGREATPSATATRAPTATPIPPTPKPGGQNIQMGFTAEGWPYRGNPDAAVTLWEFSEFQ